jgi:formylglycine-generating enzyme required for sulfatase activity
MDGQGRWVGSGAVHLLWALTLAGLAAAGEKEALPKSEAMTVDLGGGVTMDFVPIRPGSFLMGDERPGGVPVHKVTLTKGFHLGKHEVTQEQWQAVMGDNPSRSKGPKNPVEMMTWDDCQGFLKKLTEKHPGQTFRLPTEAEWEYACRAGSTTRYSFGDGALGEYAWHSGNASRTTHPVGEKKANPWGLYDMHGSVWEWCEDHYGPYQAEEQTDPTGASGKPGRMRVLRGGSWLNDPELLRSAGRSDGDPGGRSAAIGFRAVLVPGPR